MGNPRISTCRARLARLARLALLLTPVLSGCPADRPPAGESGVVTITFKHGKLAGGAGRLEGILRDFEVRTPGVHVREELLPSSTDQQHQFYAMNLDSRTSAFDVLAADVIWVQEFARAGWIRDLDHLLPANEREEYFPAAIEAASVAGRLYAVPWYLDAGVLYYRRDLLGRHGFAPPRTWPALVRTARAVLAAESDPVLRGFVWQGRQYEGLVCVALEVIWGYGGGLAPGHSREAAEALAFLRDLVGPQGVSPGLVTTADEEATRHLFGAGRAVFMRNWPYAWSLLQREDSPVRGKVGLAPLPSQPGVQPASVLGGWMLAVPRAATHPREAEQLIRYFSEPAVQRRLAQAFGYGPPRRSLYRDAALLADRPWLADVYPILETARPRPVTPYYLMLSEILQPEFSAALVGTKSPQEALSAVHRQIARFLGPAVGGKGGLAL